jgi:hypothetical protein
MRATRYVLLGLLTLSVGCGPTVEQDGEEGDLPLGEDVDIKADGWGSALKCKPIPTRPKLTAPRIVISVDGLTLHLTDQPSGVSKVYPVGVGAINHATGELTYDRSLTLYPPLATGKQDFTIHTSQVEPCKVWWTDPATGKKSPVFAGLPFLRWYGAYGIHGPVTGYTAPNGGQLQRGYVSHGCVRMEAADVAELWAYVRGVASVPVRVQKAVERDSTGLAVDVAQRWVLSECRADADCNFAGGVCLPRTAPGAGFCTARCSALCSYDKYGYPTTFCVSDGQTPSRGYCTYKASDFNDSCRRYGGFEVELGVSRFSQPSVKANVCLPR